MDHQIERKVVLTDLIDRVLDRGVAIHADVIISLAGIPLVGINLRALVAGMETMTQYGVMHDWDREIRAEGTVPDLRTERSGVVESGLSPV